MHSAGHTKQFLPNPASGPAGVGRAGSGEQPRQEAEAGGGACSALGRCRGGAGPLGRRARRDASGGRLHRSLLVVQHTAAGRAIQGGESPLQPRKLALLHAQRTQRVFFFFSMPRVLRNAEPGCRESPDKSHNRGMTALQLQ